MQTPFFSIVIPTFNQGNLLKKAINSIMNQKFQNFEIIVIDNYSKDNTKKIVKAFKKKKIIYKRLKNNGIISKSRNRGIKLSKGKWIAFLDSDDTWNKNKLEKVHQMIREKNFDVICNDEWIIKRGGQSREIWKFGPFKKNFYKYLLEFGNCLSTSASVVKKSFIKKNNIIFSERKDFVTSEDFDFFLKISKKNGKFFFLHTPLGEHLFHSKSASSNYLKHKNSWEAVIRHHIFNVQKFNNDKEKAWKAVYLNFVFKDLIFRLRNNRIKLNLLKEILCFYIFNPILSLILSYKAIVSKIVQIYSSKKVIMFQSSI